MSKIAVVTGSPRENGKLRHDGSLHQGSGGAADAARIEQMTGKLFGVMAYTGVCDTAHFDPSVIHALR